MADGPGEFEQEVVALGDALGVTVLRDFTVSGQAAFEVGGGTIGATVYKARTPDVTLENVAVYLVQRLSDTWRPGEPYELDDAYAVMVDDPYWGRRIQGAGFAPAPFSETFVMGYRVRGRILQDGEAVEGANVSLEGVCDGVSGEATFWDSEEFNELIWSDELETFVEGPTVYAPIMTDAEGRWSLIVPKGHGAIYQRNQDRRDDTAATAQQTLPRRLTALAMMYQGRRAALSEEVEAVIDVLSGKLSVSGEPGAWVRVGSLDEAGTAYAIPAGGTVLIEGLPAGEHSVVQFKLGAYGWDAAWGCARQVVTVAEGGTAAVAMGAMEAYDAGGEVLCGRVYERPGVPAAGVAITPINFETGEVLDAVATTDGGGYWAVEIPPEGLGGDPWIYDGTWGCVPLLGFPYSDVVLGARAYAGFAEIYKPEAWRKGERGHANFQYVQDAVYVQDNDTGATFATGEAAHGGWVTTATLPKFKFVGDIEELLTTGPQLHVYSLRTPDEVLMAELYLESQNFEDYETLPGQYRAAGFYPEAKFLIGGKAHGGVVTGNEGAIGLALPEAYRIGLEFGQHEWYTQIIAEAGQRMACFADLICPYCGGPTWRDPSGGGFVRGCCWQCAEMFGDGGAMDGRTHWRSATVAAHPTNGGPPPALCADPSLGGRGTAKDDGSSPPALRADLSLGGRGTEDGDGGPPPALRADPSLEGRGTAKDDGSSPPALRADLSLGGMGTEDGDGGLAAALRADPSLGGRGTADDDGSLAAALRADPSLGGRGTENDDGGLPPPPSLQGGGTTLSALVVVRSGGSRVYPVPYYWRPDLYDENDDYLVQGGLGQMTNAPRWFARHVNEVGDGLGFGRFDTADSPPFTAGHDLAWFGELPEVDRSLGVTQMKLVFGSGYVQAEDVTVELDCRLSDGTTDVVQVTIPAGTTGPSETRAISDFVPVKLVGKWTAHRRPAPYHGSGLYVAVTGARLVEPSGATCAFVIVNDVPLLAAATGVPIEKRRATPVALQLGVTAASGPHLLDDAVGQVFIFYAREGEIWMRRRAGLPGAWQDPRQVTDDGDNTEPCAEKDDAGRLRAFWQHGGDVVGAVSVDDGRSWG